MTTEEKMEDYKIEVEEYQEDFKLLLRIKNAFDNAKNILTNEYEN